MQAIIRHCTLPTRGVHHDHPWHQMVIALSGQAEFEIAGHGGRVDAMHGCLVPAGEVHFYEGTGNNRHVVLDHYNPDSAELERLFDRPRYFTADASLRLLLSFIDQEESLWQGSALAAEGMAQVIISSLHQRLFDHTPRLPAAPQRLNLLQLDNYIQQHLAEPVTVEQLAQVACVSTGHFHQLFRQATGTTPAHYLLQARLQRARNLLLETRLAPGCIAEQVGFSSQSALTHAFRRHWGSTPGVIRRLGEG
ncbi:AraC family transcriptional regulator [Pseudomonas sp. FME51]|uniref:AraC family transcriptional regulator n=1 Tax=Pseudomonas sp. FME51 TaxID=2742609 RepID=UPI001868268E|nr:helix-turn-helix domain-containing protein [Pseudomonas sp. FME51]